MINENEINNLEGKIIILKDVAALERLANGGEKIPADALKDLERMKVMRVSSGWFSCIAVDLVESAVYDAEYDSWDIEVPMIKIEITSCYEVENV